MQGREFVLQVEIPPVDTETPMSNDETVGWRDEPAFSYSVATGPLAYIDLGFAEPGRDILVR